MSYQALMSEYFVVRIGGRGLYGEVLSKHSEYPMAVQARHCYQAVCRKCKGDKVKVGDVLLDWQGSEMKPIGIM